MKSSISMISLVVPVYNEEDNINDLHAEVARAMSRQPCAWELVFVDDGSSDHSLDIIRTLASKDERVRYVSFEGNCGQSAAFSNYAVFGFSTPIEVFCFTIFANKFPATSAARFRASSRRCA